VNALEYARAVDRGEIVVGQVVRHAVDRFLRDLRDGAARGLVYDETSADRFAAFCAKFLVHSKGEWAGKPLELEGWQRFTFDQLFGWRRADGSRRFRTVYKEVARKNGKSTECAALGIYALVADREAGAEVYAAATSKDQAKIVFDEADRMVKSSPHLARRVRAFRNNLHITGTASKFTPLSSDYNTLDGLNTHCAVIDELHAHPNRELWDVLDTSTGARRQPILFGITTAGQEPTSFCGMLHDYAVQVATGALEDDSLLVYVATLDDGDDWTDPRVWIKANPNLGVSIREDELADKAAKAANDLAGQNAFRRLRLNQWLSASSRAIDLARWDACRGELTPLELEAHNAGRVCYAGLDLSSTTDLSAAVFAFPPDVEGEPFDVVARLYMPEERAFDPEARRRDRVPYDAWCDAGLVVPTPGAVVDYAWIRRDVLDFADRFTLRQVGFDPYNAQALVSQLQDEDGLEMIVMRQGFLSMSDPTKQLLRLLLLGRLRHGGHEVLRWMADNLVVRSDPAGNVKPDKEKSRQRIDGIVALVMALDLAIRAQGGPAVPSIYSSQDLAVL